ncbi:MAG: alpha-glucosidase, partial [Anaerolineales bacterium]|nr:alpha-glucosidase [Anaerolineales bacterium]
MNEFKWWQKAVFYQIYPRSFADGNGDGIGDFDGMTKRLDYLRELGIDAIWLSPHYPSPQKDCGYDISDYCNVAPEYGTLDDFIRFLNGAHERDIRVVLDLVLNHTSDQHPWFIESSSSRNNPKRDWYIWRDGQNGQLPNNWYSTFGGPAWEYDPHTDQYYYHFFVKEQPDLNWHNPEVKQAMWEVVRFWLDLGVDGFRLDAIATIFEDPNYPDHTSPLSQAELFHTINQASEPLSIQQARQLGQRMFDSQVEQPGVHLLMQEFRSIIDEYDDKVLIGENDNVAYHGDGENELHMVFNFPLMRTNELIPEWVRQNQEIRLASLASISKDAWPCNTFNNHDTSRVYSRFSDGENDEEFAHISIALLLVLPGTPFLYNGEEIGMMDMKLEDIDQFRDPWGVWNYYMEKDFLGASNSQALDLANKAGRDKCRTPMQWNNAPNAGFSPENVRTWLPINQNYRRHINVADQRNNPDS